MTVLTRTLSSKIERVLNDLMQYLLNKKQPMRLFYSLCESTYNVLSIGS